jgi:DNA-directed RNA polymerase subunit RPC12/RpoP
MATISIACPECQKEIKAPADIIGKKIRCKSCGHVFAARPAPGTGVKPASGQSSPKPPKKVRPGRAVEDDDDDANPYAVTEMSFAPRCPHCANEMESAEAIICLFCGYNTRERTTGQTRKVHETTGLDYFLWLLPGVVCLLLALGLIGYPFIHHFVLPPKIWDNWEALEKEKPNRPEVIADSSISALGYLFHPGIEIWIAVMCVAGAYYAGRFAVQRLIFNPHPPEIEKK